LPTSRWKTWSFAVVSVALGFGLLEMAARLVVAAPDVRIHEEHAELIRVLGLPALNETMIFDPYLFWRLRDELRDFPVRGRMETRSIDFAVSTERGLRRVPGGPAADSGARPLRILALGDSCTFGLGVDDDETWPSQLQRLLAAAESARVVNAGVPGYTAFQGRRLLEVRGGELAPDLVVATFGFNDIDVWGSQSDLATARSLALRRWERPLRNSRLYLGLRRTIESIRDLAAKPPSAAATVAADAVGRPRLSETEFRDELIGLADECDRLRIPLVLAIWPYGEQIWNRFPPVANYQGIVSEVCEERGIPCVDLVAAFLAAEGPLFLDHVHANAAGNAVAARAVFEAIEPLLPGLRVRE
jgi:lysophospholipase L1-like esterase